MPAPPVSLPDQLMVNVVVVVTPGNGFTLLMGYTESIVLVTVLVTMAAFTSKTMEALLVMDAPLARPVFGFTLKVTYPMPWLEELLGGRKPASGSAGEPPVVEFTDCIVQVRTPVLGFSAALSLTGFGSVETFT